MEAQTDIQTYLEQGKQALASGKGREAAIAYAHSAQIEPNTPMVHLGLAEANLALGNYGVVQMACRRVQELQPAEGSETLTAQALLDLLDRRYERALQSIDKAITEDPSIPYSHALRAYLLRATGQDYDAGQARSRATRLSYGGKYENCFPQIESDKASSYNPYNTKAAPPPIQQLATPERPKAERPEQPAQNWSRPNGMQRQFIRTRFDLSRFPTLVTTILIALNVLAFIWMKLDIRVLLYGAQINAYVFQGEYWRIFTAMFLHSPDDIFHIALNMLSLFFVGRAVEIYYGSWRYLVIYLVSGIIGGVFFLFFSGPAAIGASGAIFGVFGALGIFYLVNRRILGASGSGAIANWLFWLVLNLAYSFTPGANIALWDHIGGLIAGMVLAYLLIPRHRRGRMMV